MKDSEIAIKLVEEVLCKDDRTSNEEELKFALLGAKWMQEQLINKAYQWFEHNRAHFWYDNGEVVEQFKKAMEE